MRPGGAARPHYEVLYRIKSRAGSGAVPLCAAAVTYKPDRPTGYRHSGAFMLAPFSSDLRILPSGEYWA